MSAFLNDQICMKAFEITDISRGLSPPSVHFLFHTSNGPKAQPGWSRPVWLWETLWWFLAESCQLVDSALAALPPAAGGSGQPWPGPALPLGSGGQTPANGSGSVGMRSEQKWYGSV